ncbi:unnamed protein product [Lathyrus oleraceus]
MHWLHDSDLNTNFFHMLATERGKFKNISILVNEDNTEVKYQLGLCEAAEEYFNKLFTAKDVTHDPILANIQ